ncbi:hypothetical protein HAX54_028523 [Datura stramonium]|uniref:Uncharacterized protein n=1 Tax=Datura stramonium TaxID=4076 RepID=A0ABS8V745_DATST|nr:hypothetical protein [Datura stramonium]
MASSSTSHFEPHASTQGGLTPALGMDRLLDNIRFQGTHLFPCALPKVYEREVVYFYMNLEIKKDGEVQSKVNSVEFTLNGRVLSDILFKRKRPVSQMLLDQQNANARVAELERATAQLKNDLSTAHSKISSLEYKILNKKIVHNNRIDKLLSLMEKN